VAGWIIQPMEERMELTTYWDQPSVSSAIRAMNSLVQRKEFAR